MAVLLLLTLPLLLLFPPPLRSRSVQRVETATANSDQSGLLESGRAQKLRSSPPTTNQIKIISYNIRWRSGDDLKKMIKLFHEDPEIGNAAILGLQEVDRKKKRSGNTNTVKLIADELGMHYVWAAPPPARDASEEETGVAILSVYPISDIRRIVLPYEGPNKRRRVALGATIKVEGLDWRFYSIHGETRIAFDKKLEQMGTVLKDLASYPSNMPAIVVGDFNTWEVGAAPKTIKLFSEAGLKTPFGSEKTFCRRILFVPIEFHLDWVWLRGVDATTFGIDKKIDISDHWPLWANIGLPAASKK
jgi:endonuclease/exonuclease/phosphatase family metal-dependent hydrolase